MTQRDAHTATAGIFSLRPCRPSRRGHLVLATTLAVIAMLPLAGCGGGGNDHPTETTGLVLNAGTLAPELLGTWRVLGESRMIEWNNENIQSFHEVKSLCYADPESMSFLATPNSDLEGYTYRHVKTQDRETVDVYVTEGVPSTITLEKIPDIPAHCRQKPPEDPLTVFQTLWDAFDLDYGFFAERHIDWPGRYTKLRSQASAVHNDDELQTLLSTALEGLNDYHVSLTRFKGNEAVSSFNTGNTPTLKLLRQAFEQQTAMESFEEFSAKVRQNIQTLTSHRLSHGSPGRELNGAMVWGKLPGNIGYIELSGLAGYSDNAIVASDLRHIRSEMDKAIAALADTKALILDISMNDGGYDEVSAEIAGRFADSRHHAFTVHQHRPQGRQPQDWFVEPKGAKQYLKPVYLMTSDLTISAGDTLTLMMRVLPNVIQVGQPTSGSMSDKLAKPLPGHFLVTLSNESYVDPKGELYEGRGVPPKIALQIFDPNNPDALTQGHELALDKVIELINR